MLGKDNSVSIESLRADAEMESQFKTSYRGYDKKSVNEYIRTLKRETELEIERLKDAVHDAECERDDMKNSYLSWQQEIKLVKIQKKKEVDKAREEYEAKLQSAIEEATKKLENENIEKESRIHSIIEEKNQQIKRMEADLNISLQEALAEKEQAYEKAMAEKDKYVNDTIAEKERYIAETIEQKDREIQNLTSKLQNREETERKLQESAIESYKEANAKLTEENNRKKVIIADLEEKLALASSNLDHNMKMLDSLNLKLDDMLRAKLSEMQDIISVWSGQFEKTSEIIKDQFKAEEE